LDRAAFESTTVEPDEVAGSVSSCASLVKTKIGWASGVREAIKIARNLLKVTGSVANATALLKALDR